MTQGGGQDGRPQLRAAVAKAEAVTPPGLNGEDMVLPTGFELRRDGLYRQPSKRDDPPFWVCEPLHVLAEARPEDARDNWALLLRWCNRDGQPVEWVCPLADVAGDTSVVRRRLAGGGLRLSRTDAGNAALVAFLGNVRSPNRVTLVETTGWHEDRNGRLVFTLPERTLGEAAPDVFRLTQDPPPRIFQRRGTLAGWREEVARLCVHNDRATFAVSCAFAAPLLRLVGMEGGGVNLRGPSSTGKTTLVDMAASVWGAASKTGPNAFVRTWRATANAIENVASQHAHVLLPLDELGMVEPREIGQTLYLLADGQGKERARASGGNRFSPSWLTLVLSSSEESIEHLMQAAGQRAKAGQEVRLLDVPAPVSDDTGVFRNLHGEQSGAALAQRLRRALLANHGAAGPAFLEWLIEKLREQPDYGAAVILPQMEAWERRFVPAHADGQVKRAGRRFAIVAIAGELATEAGITGWKKGEASEAAAGVLVAWLAERGGLLAREVRHLAREFVWWMETQPASRLVWLTNNDGEDDGGMNEPPVPAPPRVMNQAGFAWFEIHPDTGERVACYGVFPVVLEREIAAKVGMSGREAARRLARLGLIRSEKEQGSGEVRFQIKKRVPGHGRPRLIVTDAKRLEAHQDADEDAPLRAIGA